MVHLMQHYHDIAAQGIVNYLQKSPGISQDDNSGYAAITEEGNSEAFQRRHLLVRVPNDVVK